MTYRHPQAILNDLTTDHNREYDRIMSISKTRARAAELRAEQARIAEELRQVEAQARLFEQEPPRGAKILIEATFPGGWDEGHAPKVYQYLAMRTESNRSAGANWYVTGQKGKLEWGQVLRLIENARTVEMFDLNFHR